MLYILKPKEEENPIVKDLGTALGNVMIEGAKVHENSLIVLTNYKKAYVIKDLNVIEAKVISETPYGILIVIKLGEPVMSKERIKEIVVIDPLMSSYKQFEVLFPSAKGKLYRLHAEGFEVIDTLGIEKPVKLRRVKKIAITPFEPSKHKQQVLAILTETGKRPAKRQEIIIAQCNFENGKATKTSLRSISEESIQGISWCGSDSVVLLYETRLEILSKDNTTAVFDFNDSKLQITNFTGYYLYNEIDGMRVLTNEHTFFIERVPEYTKKASDLMGRDSSALILNGYQKWMRKDPGAGEMLQEIKEEGEKEEEKKGEKKEEEKGEENLLNGIQELIKAATHEFDPEYQKYLLKGASFAKNFLSFGTYDADEFVAVLRNLRIINQLRAPKVKLTIILVWKDDNIFSIQEIKS